MKEKIAKIGWKNIVLAVLAVLLVISASQLHTCLLYTSPSPRD